MAGRRMIPTSTSPPLFIISEQLHGKGTAAHHIHPFHRLFKHSDQRLLSFHTPSLTNNQGDDGSRPRNKVSRCTCKMSFISHTATAPAVSSERFLGVPLGGGLKLRKPLDGVTRAQLVRFPRRYISTQARQRAVLCAAALNATCAAEQTQTVTRQSSTITIAPIQGKEKSPELDDGGTGFPPRDDGDGGGGGGGGGPNWSGGFFFFGLLAFLGFLKDKESEGPYKNERRKYAY